MSSMPSPTESLREMMRQLDDQLNRYEKHAAVCDVCGMRTGAFCEDGDWLLTGAQRKTRAVIAEWNELNGMRSDVKELAERFDWNAQLNR